MTPRRGSALGKRKARTQGALVAALRARPRTMHGAAECAPAAEASFFNSLLRPATVTLENVQRARAMVYSRRVMTATSPQRPSKSRELMPVFDLGTVPYLPVQDLQAELRTRVAERSLPGVLLLLEHPPVITLGSRGVEADVLSPALVESLGVPVVRSERGGAATLHAPGQLVSYPIMPVPRHDLRAYVNGLEQVLIDLLSTLGVPAERRRGAPGLYARDRKIASVGLRCRRWIASHGTSLNVSVDLSLFGAIVSCGETGLHQTSVLRETGAAPPISLVKDVYTRAFAEVFGLRLLETRRAGISELLRGDGGS